MAEAKKSTATAAGTAAETPYVCEHCDDSVPHSHVDEKPLVDAYRRELLGALVAVAALAVLWLAATLLLAREAAFATVLGAASWVLATALGLVAFALTRRSRPGAAAVIVGAVTTAAVTPLLALLVALLTPGGVAARAVAAGLGWLVASAVVTGVRTVRLREVLVADTREGEAARSGVVRTAGRPSPYVEAGWLVLTAGVTALCVAATALMPVVVVVLVPLNAALAVLTRRQQARAAARAQRDS